jgi:hypothetical protein
MYGAFEERLGERLLDAGFIFEQLRTIRSSEEIDRMRVAAAVLLVVVARHAPRIHISDACSRYGGGLENEADRAAR